MANITYIFTKNRKSNYLNNTMQAKEFYYGLPFINSQSNNIEIIEFNEEVTFFTKFINIFDEILRRFISLPFYTSKLISKKNIEIIKNTDHLIIIPESSGLSILIILILFKRKYQINSSIFVMGLYSKKIRYQIFKKIHFIVIKLLIMNIDNVFFLGKGEYEKACNVHNQFSNKFHYFPFCIDTDFWKSKNFNIDNNKDIIFVGNDGNRDFELLVKIAERLVDFNFIFISKNQNLKSLNLENVHVVSGEWGSEDVSDLHLKNYYERAKLCILPLRQTSQPSGQSVALQSMALGIPVLISKTEGFWDKDNFIDNQNIIFCDNSLDSWERKIKDVYKESELLNKISMNARSTVRNNFNLNIFNEKLDSFLS